MREATLSGGSWDDPVEESVLRRFGRWYNDLVSLKGLTIPRWLGFSSKLVKAQLHVFADASEKAFGAASYVRLCFDNGKVTSSLVLAKSRIAPRRSLTIWRLELQAAVLAVRLASVAASSLHVEENEIFYWTDSLTVIRWLNMEGCRLRAFVAHRVAEILEMSAVSQWRHINGSLNPADDVSRGVSPSALSRCHRWFVGPTFLQLDEQLWPMSTEIAVDADDPEVMNSPRLVAAVVHQEVSCVMHLFDRVSRFKTCVRIVAYIYRFLHYKTFTSTSVTLSAWEIKKALAKCIHVFQRFAFPEEYELLRNGMGLNPKSKLISLDPFLDEDQVIRVGGRLRQGIQLDINRHPAIIPADCSLVHRLVWQRHIDLMHSRTERVLADLRTEYWIMGGRRTVRRIIVRCSYCRRMNAKPCQQFMAPLPKERLYCAAPAFTNVGVDFFGPFEVLIGRKHAKRYGCIFTCLVSRASHLEVTHSLDTQSFILALRRFIARRGQPSVIYCDNGRNFVAAAKTLNEFRD
ncbi:hypothetical protein M514_26603 [Trichuris suis]|uniref:Integrase zinc-binding domain-containing protein n=1 Tax=Trichuris suis TaxID=68888 RepID=A0A085MVH3_9BILA|nr:hypothetical protein M514_26603 [Trichuris suis]